MNRDVQYLLPSRKYKQNCFEIPNLPQSQCLSSSKQTTANADEYVGKKKPLNTVGGNVNYCSHYGNQYGSSSKSRNRTTI
jgi:hypothetical protein